jgi:hypothetical protein
MMSVNPVLAIFIHGFGNTNQGSGNPGWYSSYESAIDAKVLANDAANGSSITSTAHQSIGPTTFTISTVDATQNLDVEMDWYSGFLTANVAGSTIDTLNMVTSADAGSCLATAVWNFLAAEKSQYGLSWDVIVIGHSRGGFVTQNFGTALQTLADADSTHAVPAYLEEIMLDPTGVRGYDVTTTQSNTTYVVPSIVNCAINYNDTLNLAPIVTLDGLTLVRADGTYTGITNVNNKSAVKSYLNSQGLLHWYTVSYLLSYQSHVNMPDWYVANGQLSTDITNFLTNAALV